MATITEDYVSFEIAKLLNKKGFCEKTIPFYERKGKFCSRIGNVCQPYDWNHDGKFVFYSAPTLQMACKWLREVHNIFIQVELYSKYNDYWFELFQNTHRLMIEKREVYNSYEEACELAIKYCLENLI